MGSRGDRATLAILDVDGTLVDTNYHHTIAWFRAFCRHGIVLPLWRIHRHIGMGGDQVVAALTDERTEQERGDDIRASESELYFELIDEVQPMEGSRELIEGLRRRGHTVVLASSAKEAAGQLRCALVGKLVICRPTSGRPRAEICASHSRALRFSASVTT